MKAYHEMTGASIAMLRSLGEEWCEQHVPGANRLIDKYSISLPERVEQHDMSEADQVLGWKPQIGFLDFLRDLKERDMRGIDVRSLWVPSELPALM